MTDEECIGVPRSVAIERLVDVITALRRDHPTRVAIEGRSAAGKSTLGDELAIAVQQRERQALRGSIDDFYRPGHKHRTVLPDWTPQRRYEEGYDYESFIDLLLQPLGPGGSRRCRTAIFDSYHDVPLPEIWTDVQDDAVAIIDGVFLLRPELRGHWDYLIWVDVDIETMVERARKRDIAWMDSEQAVIDRYRQHWIPTHAMYERLVDPAGQAHAVIDNRVPDRPVITRLRQPHDD